MEKAAQRWLLALNEAHSDIDDKITRELILLIFPFGFSGVRFPPPPPYGQYPNTIRKCSLEEFSDLMFRGRRLEWVSDGQVEYVTSQ